MHTLSAIELSEGVLADRHEIPEPGTVRALGRALRTAAQADAPVTVGQLRRIVDDLDDVVPVAETAAAVGLDVDTVIAVIGRFGTWLTHVHGGGTLPTVPASAVAAGEHRAGGHIRSGAHARAVVPHGMSRTRKQKRDVRRAVSAIVTHRPGQDELERWVMRTSSVGMVALTRMHLTSVANFARFDPEGFHRVPSDAGAVARFADAYDLLEDARRAIVRAVERLVRAAGTDLDRAGVLVRVGKDIETARPVLGARGTYLARSFELARASGTTQVLARELRMLASDPGVGSGRYVPRSIAELDQRCVAAIADAAGLNHDARERLEDELRDDLRGLVDARDLDRFIPIGVAAIDAGEADRFWSAVDAYASDADDWLDELAGVLSGVPAAA